MLEAMKRKLAVLADDDLSGLADALEMHHHFAVLRGFDDIAFCENSADVELRPIG